MKQITKLFLEGESAALRTINLEEKKETQQMTFF